MKHVYRCESFSEPEPGPSSGEGVAGAEDERQEGGEAPAESLHVEERIRVIRIHDEFDEEDYEEEESPRPVQAEEAEPIHGQLMEELPEGGAAPASGGGSYTSLYTGTCNVYKSASIFQSLFPAQNARKAW